MEIDTLVWQMQRSEMQFKLAMSDVREHILQIELLDW